MAEFLATEGVSHALAEIVKRAQERLVLISPYLRMNERIKELIEDKNRLKIDVRIVYGKDLHPEENRWLRSMRSVSIISCKNLHAKCYLNENEALLTSMNLYEFSQVNNHEMGILVSRAEEPDLYGKIREESMRIIRISDERPVTTERGQFVENPPKYSALDPTHENTRPATKTQETGFLRWILSLASPRFSAETGFCIRCGNVVARNRRRPYCGNCHARWKRYGGKYTYTEKFCHICRTKHETSLAKPLCLDCYTRSTL